MRPRNIGHRFACNVWEPSSSRQAAKTTQQNELALSCSQRRDLGQPWRHWQFLPGSDSSVSLWELAQVTKGQTLALQPIFYMPLPETALSNPQLLQLPPGKKERLQKGLYRLLQEPCLTSSQDNHAGPPTCCPRLPHPNVVFPIPTLYPSKSLDDSCIWGAQEETCFTSFFRKHLHFPFVQGKI